MIPFASRLMIGVGNSAAAFQQIYTASGLIDPGDVLALNGDGTVSIVSGTVEPATQTPYKEGPQVECRDMDCAYDPVNDLWVVTYSDRGDAFQDIGMAVIVTKTVMNTLEFGTPVAYTPGRALSPSVDYHEQEGCFVFLYIDTTDGSKLKARTATISGGTLSFSDAVTLLAQSFYYAEAEYHPGSNLIVVLHAYGSPPFASSVMLSTYSVAGAVITPGAAKSVFNSLAGSFSLACSSVSNKCFVTFADDYQGGYTQIYLYDVTFAEITYHQGQNVISDYTSSHAMIYEKNSDKFVMAYSIGTASNDDSFVQVASVLGNAFTLGTAVNIKTSFSNWTALGYDGASGETTVLFRTDDRIRIRVGHVSGSDFDLTPIPPLGDDMTDGLDGKLCIIASSDTNGLLLAWNKSFLGDAIKAQHRIGEHTGSNVDSWTGLSAQAAVDGALITVDKPGGRNSHQSGLIVGETYYVHADGQVNTTPSAYVLGSAVSPTEIRLNPV